MNNIEVIGLLIQLVVPIFGTIITWKIYKLINHGNGWWLMSAGFFMFFIQTLITLFAPKDSAFWYDIRLVYSPVLTRSFFLLSAYRILLAATEEHKEKLAAEHAAEDNLSKLRELTEKIDNVVTNCNYWDEESKKCNLLKDK